MNKPGLLTLLTAAALLLPPWVMLAQDAGCAMPLPEGAYWMSSPYGMRVHPLAGVPRMHLGVDWACPVGTRVHAVAGGVVAFAGRWGCYGTVLILRHPGDVVTLYAHLSRIAPNLRPGVPVRSGQAIARSGATGCVSGPHLHFEVWQAGKRLNPMLVCASVLSRPSKRSRSVGEVKE